MACQQQVSHRKDQKQAVDPVGLCDLRVPKRPAIAFVLAVVPPENSVLLDSAALMIIALSTSLS